MGRVPLLCPLFFCFTSLVEVARTELRQSLYEKFGAALTSLQKKLFQSNYVRYAGHLRIDGRLAYLVAMTNTYAIE